MRKKHYHKKSLLWSKCNMREYAGFKVFFKCKTKMQKCVNGLNIYKIKDINTLKYFFKNTC